ncbi:MAG: UDP-N-acetylmuramoyl-L-alanine--D-glutamate ligase [Elusimicrobiales bacterium]|jgi:UDP-N-acetylmuramoylalanine--D-glutamate ligase
MFIPEKFKGKKALVIGAGRSGVAAANLLLASGGFRVLLSDNKPLNLLKDRLRGLNAKVEVETGGHTAGVLACGFAVKSPGLPHSHPLIVKLRKNGIPVFSEIETALAFSGTSQVLAVTGTNGKTTTTILLGEIMKRVLKTRGAKAWICGNVGTPASEIASKAGTGDAIVMEVSSYQLEDSSYLSPAAACVLNITPDHLEHHRTMAGYINAKAKIFRFQKKDDAAVFNFDDARCRRLAARCPCKTLFFSSSAKGGALDAWVEDGAKIILKWNGKRAALTPPALPGLHNLENAMCAGLMALARGAGFADIQRTFSAFKGVEHRIEPAGKARGLAFINDSKATNVDSTLVALKALGTGRKNIWLILGGLDKGSPYGPLAPLIGRSVRTVLAIGAAAAKIERELRCAGTVIRAGTIAKALAIAAARGKKGDIVLLSPACASFDQFKDYEDRGRKFKALVKKL